MHLERYGDEEKAVVTVESQEEQDILAESIHPSWLLKDWILHYRLAARRANFPLKTKLSHAQLGRIMVGIEVKWENYLEVGGNFDGYRPGIKYDTAGYMLEELEEYFHPSRQAEIIPFPERKP
ncbi:hypothetical protein KW789_01215 [Candidatus Saccharibacteria bacterium]|nr:hypothetical protein [Candidatus Saccharibacteria bacterium]